MQLPRSLAAQRPLRAAGPRPAALPLLRRQLGLLLEGLTGMLLLAAAVLLAAAAALGAGLLLVLAWGWSADRGHALPLPALALALTLAALFANIRPSRAP